MSADAATPQGDAPALASALRALGVAGEVEARAGLAVLTTEADVAARLAEPGRRGEALALAKRHGFTHLAVELADDQTPAGAALLRD